MERWELEALGVQDLREVRDDLAVRSRYQKSGHGSGWLVSLFYAQNLWDVWRVGVVVGTANFEVPSLSLPEPIRFEPCEKVEALLLRCIPRGSWRRACVSPIVIADEALGFAICGLAEPWDDEERFAQPGPTCEVVAPTRLDRRLRLKDGDEVTLRFLSARRYRPRS